MTTSQGLVNEMESSAVGLWDILVQIPSSALAEHCRKEREDQSPIMPDQWVSEQMTGGQ